MRMHTSEWKHVRYPEIMHIICSPLTVSAGHPAECRVHVLVSVLCNKHMRFPGATHTFAGHTPAWHVLLQRLHRHRRYGAGTVDALRQLYAEGGIRRFYRGVAPALIEGPLIRWGGAGMHSTAALAEERAGLTSD